MMTQKEFMKYTLIGNLLELQELKDEIEKAEIQLMLILNSLELEEMEGRS